MWEFAFVAYHIASSSSSSIPSSSLLRMAGCCEYQNTRPYAENAYAPASSFCVSVGGGCVSWRRGPRKETYAEEGKRKLFLFLRGKKSVAFHSPFLHIEEKIEIVRASCTGGGKNRLTFCVFCKFPVLTWNKKHLASNVAPSSFKPAKKQGWRKIPAFFVDHFLHMLKQ